MTKIAVCPIRIFVDLLLWYESYGMCATIYYEGPYLRYSIHHQNIDLEGSENLNLLNKPIP